MSDVSFLWILKERLISTTINLSLFPRHQISEPDGRQSDEGEVGGRSQAPVDLPFVVKDGAGHDVDEHDAQRHNDWDCNLIKIILYFFTYKQQKEISKGLYHFLIPLK